MSSNPNTLRVHTLLASSYPIPLTSRQIGRLLGMEAVVARKAVFKAKESGSIKAVRRIDHGLGYAYTVDV
jgi:DNA-binding transcriptional regulator LsrR (DeoR family)